MSSAGYDSHDRVITTDVTISPKRTYNNQELGPFINHEMNRCIQCLQVCKVLQGTMQEERT